jgi:uncharacterized protein
MRTSVLIPMLMLAFSAWAQTRPVKVIFDVSSKDEATHQAVMRHVSMMASAYPASQFEVVIYGGALAMVLRESSTVANEIQQLKGHTNVSFKVCEETMKRYNAQKSQLLTGVDTVPDAILEIVTKQGEGWGYIKEAHN